jgi:hypothetical protein
LIAAQTGGSELGAGALADAGGAVSFAGFAALAEAVAVAVTALLGGGSGAGVGVLRSHAPSRTMAAADKTVGARMNDA